MAQESVEGPVPGDVEGRDTPANTLEPSPRTPVGRPAPPGPGRPLSGRDIRDTLGLLGLVGSLLFVGLEIRQNTRVARAEAYRGVEQAMIQWNFIAATDDELVPILRGVTFEGLRRDQLSDPDKWRAGVMYDALVRAYESIYRQVEEGILPADALGRFVNIGFTTAYMTDLWPVLRPNYRDDFVRYFETRFDLAQ